MLPTVRQEIGAVDRNVPLTNTGSLEGYLERYSYSIPKFGLLVIASFAGIGLALVIIGVFSVMAYTVSLQTHEIGIRMALGATRRGILTLVTGEIVRLLIVGLVIGSVLALAIAPAIRSLLYGLGPNDPVTVIAAAAGLAIVGMAASLLPALRASRLHPMLALRDE